MKQIILDSPRQFKIGSERAKGVGIKGSFDNVVICGIGGSALPGSLLLDMAIDLKMPLYIHRDYGLPRVASKKSLIFCISFSGNTEETLSAYQEALEKGYNVVAVSTGGKIEAIAKENDKPVVIVPNDCAQPRFGTGYLVSAVLQVLENCGIVQGEINKLLAVAEKLNPASFEEQGKTMAEKLVDKIPVVYSSASYKAVARIWKIKFNENSKILAFWNYFPELNHNEMVGLTNLKGNFHFIILRDQDDNPRTQKRMELFAQLAQEKAASVDFYQMYGKIKLEKILTTLLVGDWVSYYLALAYNQDPTPVKIVEDFKKRLAQ